MSTLQAQRPERRRSRPAHDGAVPLDVLVLDAEQRQSLVCVRSLGAAGVRAGAFASSRAPAFSSRWCVAFGSLPSVAEAPDDFVGAVIERARRHGSAVVVCTHDGSIEALRRRRSEVEQHVGLALAEERSLAVAVSKERTLAVAAELGIAVPRGAVVDAGAELDALGEELGFPLVVKPSASWAARSGRRLVGAVVRDRREARAAVENIVDAGGSALVQEWLTGAREAVSLLRTNGVVKARFAQVAYRMHPPLGGSSVTRESIPLPPDIARAAEQLVDAIDLDGYCEVEFRRDAAGRAKLMEINPRLSASVEIAVRAGVDFPLLLYAWAAGDEVPAVGAYRTGLRMRWLGGDLLALREALTSRGRPECARRWPAIRAFVGDFFRPAHYDYLDRGDLGPALAASAGWLRDHRLVRRGGKPRPAPTDPDQEER